MVFPEKNQAKKYNNDKTRMNVKYSKSSPSFPKFVTHEITEHRLASPGSIAAGTAPLRRLVVGQTIVQSTSAGRITLLMCTSTARLQCSVTGHGLSEALVGLWHIVAIGCRADVRLLWILHVLQVGSVLHRSLMVLLLECGWLWSVLILRLSLLCVALQKVGHRQLGWMTVHLRLEDRLEGRLSQERRTSETRWWCNRRSTIVNSGLIAQLMTRL